jgi:hypothetical protein
MEELSPATPRGPTIFNSVLETGIRQLIILDALYPRPCDLKELTCFDHLVVHSADVGGPESLHPAIAARGGELAVRRETIQQSLGLMQRAHLIEQVNTDQGVGYVATDDAPIFIDALSSEYSLGLKSRAQWISTTFSSMSAQEIEQFVQAHIGYRAFFVASEQPGQRT